MQGLARILTLIMMLGTSIGGTAGAPTVPFRASVAQAAGLPEFQPVSLTVPSNGTLYIGQTYTATFTVQNVGSTPTSGTLVDELWLSKDTTYDPSDRRGRDQMWTGGPVAPGGHTPSG